MNSSSLRALLIDWAAMACAVAVFLGAALDAPEVSAAPAGSTAATQVRR